MFLNRFIKRFFSYSLLLCFLIIHNEINTKEINGEINSNSYSSKTDYILGPGDTIGIYFSGLDIFSGEYPINNEGFVFLPEIRLLYVF